MASQGHFTQQLGPQPFQFSTARRGVSLGQGAQRHNPIVGAGGRNLCGGHGLLHDGRTVTSHLTRKPKHLTEPEAREVLFQTLVEIGNLEFVAIVFFQRRFTGRVGITTRGQGIFQHLGLFRASRCLIFGSALGRNSSDGCSIVLCLLKQVGEIGGRHTWRTREQQAQQPDQTVTHVHQDLPLACGAGTGTRSRSGAPTFFATNRASLTALAKPSSRCHWRLAWFQ